MENLHCPSCVRNIQMLLNEAPITQQLKDSHAVSIDISASISTQLVSITIHLTSDNNRQAAQDSVHEYIKALKQADFEVNSASMSVSTELGSRGPATVIYTASDSPGGGVQDGDSQSKIEHFDICTVCRMNRDRKNEIATSSQPSSSKSELQKGTTLVSEREDKATRLQPASETPAEVSTETQNTAITGAISVPGMSPPQAPSAVGVAHTTSVNDIRTSLCELNVAQPISEQPGLGGSDANNHESGVNCEYVENLNYQSIPPLSTFNGNPSLTSTTFVDALHENRLVPSLPELQPSNPPTSTCCQKQQVDSIETPPHSNQTSCQLESTATEIRPATMEPGVPLVVVDRSLSPTASPNTPERVCIWQRRFLINGMTCATCSGKIEQGLEQLPIVRSAEVSLMQNSALVEFSAPSLDEGIQSIIEAVSDMGFECTEAFEIIEPEEPEAEFGWVATLSIPGMTCGACTGKVVEVLRPIPGVRDQNVSFIDKTAIVTFEGDKDEMIQKFITAIDDGLGFECLVHEVTAVEFEHNKQERSLQLEIDGMYCP